MEEILHRDVILHSMVALCTLDKAVGFKNYVLGAVMSSVFISSFPFIYHK